MKNKFLVVASAALVAMMSFVPAFAQTGEIEITGGTLSVSPALITIDGVTLNNLDHPNVAGDTTVWTVTDPTGSGAGWHVNISATDFANLDNVGKTIAVTGFEAQLLNSSIERVNGNVLVPTSTMETAVALTVVAQELASAAENEGMGTYTLLPTFTLDVPSSTYAGSYVSTVTVDIVAAP